MESTQAINPIRLNGNWKEGYALDVYVLSSTYIGEDAFGIKHFDNKYTEIGTLLHNMKYNGHIDTSNEILKSSIPFLDKWLSDKTIDAIIPVHPTKDRDIQPIFVIAETIANHYKIPFSSEVLVNMSPVSSKNMDKNNKDLSGQIIQELPAKRHCNLLLVDDLYTTGETASECVKILKQDQLIDEIYLLTIVKTKNS